MKIIKSSKLETPEVSLILLDWNVRESFHFLEYMKKQTVERKQFEVILIEYYGNISPVAERYRNDIDCWILLEMPPDLYYHKHLMYNAGIIFSKGKICVICDSDAMASPTFIETIIGEFKGNESIVLHIDQFRNMRKDLYPFNYPTFQEVLGLGCKNNVNGKTTGLVDIADPIHTRNYGACMCARRDDLIEIGGADEHIDYLGHICGPYDMTFRLVNSGLREVWHETEFTMHTWHPGAAGVDNYLGPHDGRHVSTTALSSLSMGRTKPFVSNRSVDDLGQDKKLPVKQLLQNLISPANLQLWKKQNLNEIMVKSNSFTDMNISVINYYGFRLTKTHESEKEKFIAYKQRVDTDGCPVSDKIVAHELKTLKLAIDKSLPFRTKSIMKICRFCFYNRIIISYIQAFIRNRSFFLSSKKKKTDNKILTDPSVSPDGRGTVTNIMKFDLKRKIKQRYSHLLGRFDQLSCEMRFFGNGLDGVILFLSNHPRKMKDNRETLLYVSGTSLKICAKIIRKMYNLQNIKIIQIETFEKAKEEFQYPVAKFNLGPKVISSLLFCKFYQVFSEFKKKSDSTVLIV